MDIGNILAQEPMTWAAALLLIIGASGYLAAITAVGLYSKVIKEGLYWLLAHLKEPYEPGEVADVLIKAAIPVVLVMGAYVLAVLGGYEARTMDTWFAAAQVAGTVAIGGYIAAFLGEHGGRAIGKARAARKVEGNG